MFNRIVIVSVLAVIATACPGVARADDAPSTKREVTFSLGDAGVLHVALPAGWSGKSDDANPPTVELKAPAGKHASIQVTPVPGRSSDEALKRVAQQIGARYAEGSVEKRTTLVEVKGDAVHGYVSSYTDSSADPGEFRYVTAGVLACGGQVLAVTVLYNDKAGPERSAATDAVKTFSIPAGAATLTSPDGTWRLTIPGAWHVEANRVSRDGKSRQVTAQSADGSLMLTVFFEPTAGAGGDATAARKYYADRMKRNPMPMENLKEDASGDVATLDYDQGPAVVKRHNLNAYVAHGGVWVDVHVSKASWDEKADRKALDAIAKGLTVSAAK